MAKNEKNYNILLSSDSFLQNFEDLIKEYQALTGCSKSYMKQDFHDLINYFSPSIVKGAKSKDTSWKGAQKALYQGRGRKWVYIPLHLIEDQLLEWGEEAEEFYNKVKKVGTGWGHYYSPRMIDGKKFGMFELRINSPKFQHAKHLVAIPDEMLSSLHRLENGKTPLGLGLEEGKHKPSHLQRYVPAHETVVTKENLRTETGVSFCTLDVFNDLTCAELVHQSIKDAAEVLDTSYEYLIYFTDEENASEKFTWKWVETEGVGKVKIANKKYDVTSIMINELKSFFLKVEEDENYKDVKPVEVSSCTQEECVDPECDSEHVEKVKLDNEETIIGQTIIGLDTLIDDYNEINEFIKKHEEKAKNMEDEDEGDELYFKAYEADCMLNPQGNATKEIKIIVDGNDSYFSDGIEICSLDELIDHLEIVGDFGFEVYLNIILRHFQNAGFENVYDESEELKMSIEDYLKEI